jgi:hypothetical protein
MPLILSILLTICIIPATYAGELIANLKYGDSREVVTSKLISCKLVKSTVPKTMFARIGLNGSFATTKELQGLKFTLYFDWTESSGLKEINYRSNTLGSSSYDQQLKQKWQYAYNLISSIYGRASNAGEYPKKNEITSGKIQFSHEWETNDGYIYLGVGQQENKYSLNITFSQFSLKAE